LSRSALTSLVYSWGISLRGRRCARFSFSLSIERMRLIGIRSPSM
jgi:hypothetical protein